MTSVQFRFFVFGDVSEPGASVWFSTALKPTNLWIKGLEPGNPLLSAYHALCDLVIQRVAQQLNGHLETDVPSRIVKSNSFKMLNHEISSNAWFSGTYSYLVPLLRPMGTFDYLCSEGICLSNFGSWNVAWHEYFL